MPRTLWAAFILTTTLSVTAQAEPVGPIQVASPAQWDAYWNQGKAEITNYDLKQARYGEVHDGHAVLIYVTEPFSKRKQVKLDQPGRAGADAVPVLKLNHTRKFNTGVYPYSVMRSVFTPVQGDHKTLKVSTSSQEWCGHVFMQLNLQNQGDYAGRIFSYFESEGDNEVQIPAGAVLEDDIWTLIRINPNRLPQGEVSMVPLTTYLRLRHAPVRARKAKAALTRLDKNRLRYQVTYLDMDRVLTIDFEAKFPFRIASWSEAQPSGWGPSKKRLTTEATLNKRIVSDYWNRHRKSDLPLRKQLGLH